VADEVHIDTLSYKADAKPVHWECDGGTEFSMDEGDKAEVGTKITLFLNEDCLEFCNEYKAREIIKKYCSFMPTEIYLSKADTKETQIIKPEGSAITQNSEVLRVSPNTRAQQVVVCYVATTDAQKVSRGDYAYISLSSSDSKSYGHMVGRVINIDAGAASASAQSNVLGSENNLSNAFSSDGKAVTAVTCELFPSDRSASGYFWSNSRGETLSVNNRDICSVKIITKQVRPIEKLFERIIDLWEGKR